MNDLVAAEIPIPEGFHGQRRSYTLSLDGACGSVGVLWAEKQLYISNSKGAMQLSVLRCFHAVILMSRKSQKQGADGLRINNKGGTTVSVKKCGGWAASWELARTCAGLGAAWIEH